MKIEVGKSYRTRDGDLERIAEINPARPYGRTHPFIADSGRSYREDGCYLESAEKCGADLVAEIDGNGEPVETGGCAPPVIVEPPITVAAESLADELPPPAGPSIEEMIGAGTIPPPQPSARQLASALRLLVREADRYSDYADNSLQLTDAIILAESVLDRLAP